jgi:hypothetical protein
MVRQWIAAGTETFSVADQINSPLRPPVLLARRATES